jgi:outer membrane receptor protein involved in Fe transport
MQIRGLILAAVVAALGPMTAAGQDTPQAQQSSAAEPLEVEAIDGPAQAGRDPYAPPAGMEERVILAGESDAAADFETGDSITGFDAADLEALGALSVADIGKFTPNLEIVTTGATTPTFFIRGVGLNDFNANSASSVAIYQDDVAMNSPALQLGTIFDMERVNVLRGPVGTGPARNASAGAIKLYSRKPVGHYNGYLRSTGGDYKYLDFEGAVEVPIFEDMLSGRVAFRLTKRDGYLTNSCGGQPPASFRAPRPLPTPTDPNAANLRPWSLCGENVASGGVSPIEVGLPEKVNDLGNWAVRGTLRFQPTLDMDWLLNVHGGRRDQFSTQGLSYGTSGNTFLPDGSSIEGRLGAPDAQEYRRFEVLEMTNRLQQILLAPKLAACGPDCGDVEKQVLALDAGRAAQTATAAQIGASLDTNPFRGDYNRIGKTINETWGTYLKGDIALPKDLMLRTVSGFDAYDRLLDSDTDQSPNVLFEIKTDDQGWQFFQDLELSGATTDVAKVEWAVGGYYLGEMLDVQIENDFGQATILAVSRRDYQQTTQSFGVYGKLAWTFFDDFTLDGGIRFNWEDKKMDYALVNSASETKLESEVRRRSAPTGEARLTYKFREDTHAYFKYTRGWKGGHFNATASERKGVTYAEPETNNAFESGLRGSYFDGRVGMDASFFFYDYDNYQLFTVENDVSARNPEFVVINASAVEVYGAEADVSGRPWNGAFVNVRFSWLESTFVDFVQRQFISDRISGRLITRVNEINYSGNRLLNSPRFKISLTGEQTVPLGRYGSLTARYDSAWSDTTYYDPTEGTGLPNSLGQTFLPPDTIGQKPFWIHNALVIYRPPVGNLELQGWVRNFTNQVYKTFAFDASQFQETTIYFVGEPRMWGLTLILNF